MDKWSSFIQLSNHVLMKISAKVKRSVRDNMYTKDEWFQIICDSYHHPPVIYNNVPLPNFPSDQIQTATTGQSGTQTLKEAFIFYDNCIDTFQKIGKPANQNHTLLDFGIGWGRIARFFLREITIHNIYGIDVEEELIGFCRHAFSTDNFHTTSPFPPTKYSNGKFDFIVGYSVFSHLSEAACSAWVEEFYRILKPNGIVAMTTRGRSFFDFCESLKGKGHEGYLGALSTMFDDFAEARKKYDRGEFVHSNRQGVSGGGSMNSGFYGESFIPEKYAQTAYNKYFNLKYFINESVRNEHPIMFFQKIR